MFQSYDVGKALKKKFNTILGKKENKNNFKFQNNILDE